MILSCQLTLKFPFFLVKTKFTDCSEGKYAYVDMFVLVIDETICQYQKNDC